MKQIKLTSQTVLADRQLSLSAKAAMLILMQSPNGVLFRDLVSRSSSSQGSVRRALAQLSARKYALSALVRKNGKLVGRQWIPNPNFSAGHDNQD